MIAAKTTDIPLRTAARKINLPSGASCGGLTELRLRCGREAVAVLRDGSMTVCSGRLTSDDIAECFQELCRNSVHSYSREIAEGYITLEGGHRVGFCGTAVISGGRLTALKDISSLNIRFAREVKGCAEELYRRAFSDGICSLLVTGLPLSGKTTVLRDLARILGQSRRVALIDSRGELAACLRGTPQLDVGANTDVLSGYPKTEGIMCALRSLSPEMIICDEISGEEQAIKHCLHCGVKMIASIHAAGAAELKRRGDAALLSGFDKAAFLEPLGRLRSVESLRGGELP